MPHKWMTAEQEKIDRYLFFNVQSTAKVISVRRTQEATQNTSIGDVTQQTTHFRMSHTLVTATEEDRQQYEYR